jgi:hypothetical protein
MAKVKWRKMLAGRWWAEINARSLTVQKVKEPGRAAYAVYEWVENSVMMERSDPGARPTSPRAAKDLAEEVAARPAVDNEHVFGMSSSAAREVLKALAGGPRDFEALKAVTAGRFPVEAGPMAVVGVLVNLELAGLARRLPGNRWERSRRVKTFVHPERTHCADAWTEDGLVWRWCSNDRPVPPDAAREYNIPVDQDAQGAAEKEYLDRVLADYRRADPTPDAEQLCEMRAAFGEGARVVDVITGRVTQL